MKAIQIEQELTEEEYDDQLNDIYGEIDVCGYKWPASFVLHEVDPTAYNCGKNDFEGNLDPKWQCSECEEVFDTEEEAEECCKPESGE
ncbi:MAG: hypothetical protein WC365_08905 [Candidatus Babeliales bacterium]|jgi:hypothetical protein